MDSVFGWVGRAVASNTRGPQFLSIRREFFYTELAFTANCWYEDKRKKVLEWAIKKSHIEAYFGLQNFKKLIQTSPWTNLLLRKSPQFFVAVALNPLNNGRQCE